jgi:hypothetical protein
MNQHQQIQSEMNRQYENLRDAVLVSPSGLAHRVFETFATGDEGAQIQYTSLEHLKQMARQFLRHRKEPDSDESNAYSSQGELPGISFSGQLQDRYPVPRNKDEEPVYKLRSHLSKDERAWNVKQLRKSAKARQEHADALEAEGDMQKSA